MSEREEGKEKKRKDVFIVSDSSTAGIEKVVERNGFSVTGVVRHDEWAAHTETWEICHLVILDEVNRHGGAGNSGLWDAEDRMLTGNSGPFILVLVDDDDHALDLRERKHRRCIVHHVSNCLDALLQEIYAARPTKFLIELL